LLCETCSSGEFALKKPEVCKSRRSLDVDMGHIKTVFICCALSLTAEYVEGFEAIYDMYISTTTSLPQPLARPLKGRQQ
jgi:hypothetical protein